MENLQILWTETSCFVLDLVIVDALLTVATKMSVCKDVAVWRS